MQLAMQDMKLPHASSAASQGPIMTSFKSVCATQFGSPLFALPAFPCVAPSPVSASRHQHTVHCPGSGTDRCERSIRGSNYRLDNRQREHCMPPGTPLDAIVRPACASVLVDLFILDWTSSIISKRLRSHWATMLYRFHELAAADHGILLHTIYS